MLILGSHSFYYPNVARQIRELLPDRSGKMLLIGLAMEEGMAAKRLKREVNAAVMTDFEEDNITVFDERSPESALQQDYDYIVVLGGNTFRLLFFVRKFGLDDFIRKQLANGAHYLGFSAGAYLACPDVEYVIGLDDNNRIVDGNFKAMGLIQDYLLCHFEEDDRHDTRKLVAIRRQLGDDATVHPIRMEELLVLKNTEMNKQLV